MPKKKSTQPSATPPPAGAQAADQQLAPQPAGLPPADPPPEKDSVARRQPPTRTEVRGRKGEMVRTRYASDETGWAEVLGGGKYRIANIPLTDGLNLGDVVRCRVEQKGELLELVVSRRLKRGYPKKTFVRYERPKQLRLLCQKVLAAGAEIAGVGDLRVGQPGLVQVAHGPDFDPLAAAKQVGIKHPEV
jgi:hypothetical protein